MAERKCYHCGEPLSANDTVCPRCGAAVEENREPQTIYELRTFCAQHNMPLEKMRFFLDEDYREPRAFGIYQDDDGDFVVYKNKADGTRAVRYKGPDEARAVHEIYQKLLSEIELRKGRSGGAPNRSGGKANLRRGCLQMIVAMLIFSVIGIAAMLIFAFSHDPPGYYRNNNDYYYTQRGDWYYFDQDGGSWAPWYGDTAPIDDPETSYVGPEYYSSYGVEDFSDSDYASSHSSDDSDWDDDWDDWDDFDTDWDSDW